MPFVVVDKLLDKRAASAPVLTPSPTDSLTALPCSVLEHPFARSLFEREEIKLRRATPWTAVRQRQQPYAPRQRFPPQPTDTFTPIVRLYRLAVDDLSVL